MSKATPTDTPPHPAYQAWADGTLAPVPAIRSMYSELAVVSTQIATAEAIRAGLRRDLGEVVRITQPRGTIVLEQATLRWIEPSVTISLTSERVREAQQILSDALDELEQTGDVGTVLAGARQALATLQSAWRTSNRVGYLVTQNDRSTSTVTLEPPKA